MLLALKNIVLLWSLNIFYTFVNNEQKIRTQYYTFFVSVVVRMRSKYHYSF